MRRWLFGRRVLSVVAVAFAVAVMVVAGNVSGWSSLLDAVPVWAGVAKQSGSTLPVATLSTSSATVSESVGTVTVTVTLDPLPSQAVEVEVEVGPDSSELTADAVLGSDYDVNDTQYLDAPGLTHSWSVAFAVGQGTKSFDIDVKDDSLIDDGLVEAVEVRLVSPAGSSPAYALGTVSVVDHIDC